MGQRHLQKGSPMFTAEQYRTKAAEYSKLLETANGPNEVREFQKLQRSFTELADNEQWVNDHRDQTLHAPEHDEAGVLTCGIGPAQSPS
jgi:hypothetical protein